MAFSLLTCRERFDHTGFLKDVSATELPCNPHDLPAHPASFPSTTTTIFQLPTEVYRHLLLPPSDANAAFGGHADDLPSWLRIPHMPTLMALRQTCKIFNNLVLSLLDDMKIFVNGFTDVDSKNSEEYFIYYRSKSSVVDARLISSRIPPLPVAPEGLFPPCHVEVAPVL